MEVIPLAPARDWQAQLREAISSPTELARLLALDPALFGDSAGAANDFPLKVPLAFVRRMQPGNAQDPLLRQVMASGLELTPAAGFGADPVGEIGDANVHPGIIRKYAGRALLLVAAGCAVNCRYCFRRHFPYGDNPLGRRERHAAINWLASQPDITEVILSGGDPLIARDDYLAELVDQLLTLPHLKTLRVHTRLPIVLPDRITTGLLNAICRPGLKTVVVLHSNHANEIDASVGDACMALREGGVTLLNQAVLLAGVNDNVGALAELGDALFNVGVLPYYLHLLDRVAGAAHFEVEEERARRLIGELAESRPGYLVPRLVREVPGAGSKREVAPVYSNLPGD